MRTLKGILQEHTGEVKREYRVKRIAIFFYTRGESK